MFKEVGIAGGLSIRLDFQQESIPEIAAKS